jgi:branched-chain amino acid transport system permease protein
MISERSINFFCITLLLLFSLLAHYMDKPYLVTLATRVTIFAMAAIGLNLVLGFGNLISFGHAAFFGLGGYISGILATHAFNSEPILNWPIIIPGSSSLLVIWTLTIVLCAILGLVMGFFCLRTTGVYFIMITLAFAQMLYYFSISWPSYGGEDGLPIFVRSTLLSLNTMNGLSFFLICFFWLSLSLYLTSRIIQSPFGVVLRACRNNLDRVKSVGIKPFRVQLLAFIFSGIITGIAGSLYADLNRFVSPSSLSWQMSGELIVFIIIGGVGYLYGPLIGAIFFVTFEQVFGSYTEHWQVFLGLLIIITVLFARGGLIRFLSRSKDNE